MEPSRIEISHGRDFLPLYDSIRQLLTFRDPDGMFHAVVKHAYMLMATDVVYVSLFEEHGQVIHVAHGILDAAYIQNRLAPHEGIGGKVEATQAPVWTTNYLEDVRFEHSAETDVILEREGIVALLGVPMKAGNDFFGVLFAGNRTSRTFSPEEVAMFSTFADLASEALVQAKERRQMEEKLDEMRRDHAAATRRIEQVNESDRVHAAITDLLLAGGEATDILATLSAHVEGDVFADGYSAGFLGMWPPESGSLDHSGVPQVTDALARSRRMGRAQIVEVALHGESAGAPASNGGTKYLTITAIPINIDEFGLLQVESAKPLELSKQSTVEYAAKALGLYLLQRNAASDAWKKMRSNLLTEILSSSGAVGAETVAHANAQRISLERMTTLVAARWDGTVAPIRSAPDEYDGYPLLTGEYMGQIFVLSAATDIMEFAGYVREIFEGRAGERMQVVAAPFSFEASPARLATRLARALAVSERMGLKSPVLNLDELAPYSMIIDPDREQDYEAFMEFTVGILRRHDQTHGTELLTTLATFFQYGQQQKRTAEALYIHINTLVRRLAKIDILIGNDWRTGPRSAALHLAAQFVSWGSMERNGNWK